MAIYTTAAYQVPLVNIVQAALADVIFPDMVRRSKRDPGGGTASLETRADDDRGGDLPAWLLLTYWASPCCAWLFTDAYVAAPRPTSRSSSSYGAPVFQFSTLLRSCGGQCLVRAFQLPSRWGSMPFCSWR